MTKAGEGRASALTDPSLKQFAAGNAGIFPTPHYFEKTFRSDRGN